jgi:ABC-type transport system substrate-binding protein
MKKTWAIAGGIALLLTLMVWSRVRHSHANNPGTASAGQTLTIAQGADMESLEPNSLNSMSSVGIADLLWVRLLELKADGSIVPMLASDYYWNDAGDEITFHINKGYRCQDGSPLSARDVV